MFAVSLGQAQVQATHAVLRARPSAPQRCWALGVDGDHLPAATPDQEDSVQPLGQDLKKLHVVLISLPVFGGPWHVEQDQLCVLGLVEDDAIELHSRVHPPDVGLVPAGEVGTVSGQQVRPTLWT